MKDAVCTVQELGSHVDLSMEERRQLENIVEKHPIRVTSYYMSLIDWNDPHDPIRKMAIPSMQELSLEGV